MRAGNKVQVQDIIIIIYETDRSYKQNLQLSSTSLLSYSSAGNTRSYGALMDWKQNGDIPWCNRYINVYSTDRCINGKYKEHTFY